MGTLLHHHPTIIHLQVKMNRVLLLLAPFIIGLVAGVAPDEWWAKLCGEHVGLRGAHRPGAVEYIRIKSGGIVKSPWKCFKRNVSLDGEFDGAKKCVFEATDDDHDGTPTQAKPINSELTKWQITGLT